MYVHAYIELAPSTTGRLESTRKMYKESFEDCSLMVQIRLALTVTEITVELIFFMPHIILTGLIGLSGIFPPWLQRG